MSNKFTEALFEKLKESYYKEPTTGVGGSFLKLSPGNTYTIRLVPNINDPENLTSQYFKHAFRSVSTGQFVNFMCPSTVKEPCPFCSKQFEIWDLYKKTKEEKYKELTKPVRRVDRRLVNVYVVDDPSNPKNNGTVKILEYGKGGDIDKCIDNSLNGLMADEHGKKIFDLSPKGMNMQIQVTKNKGNFNEYLAMFKAPSALPNVTNIDAIYDMAIDLTKVPVYKTFDEIKRLLDTESGVIVSNTDETIPAPAPAVMSRPSVSASASKPVVHTATPVAKPSETFDDDAVARELAQYMD